MRVLIIATLSISLLFFVGSAFSKSDEICCTWLNAKYDSGERPQKLIFNYDGTFETYRTQASRDAIMRGVFHIAKKWQDSKGAIWYQIKMMDMYGIKYKLARVSQGGEKLEFVCQDDKYPAEIKINASSYCSYLRASVK